MAFLKEGKTNIVYILIVVILAMAVAGNASARPLEARVITDYGFLRGEAEN